MPPKYFDTHCHLNFQDYYSDTERDACLARAREAGVWMINVGSDLDNSRRAIEIAEKNDEGVFATVGLHPNDNIISERFDIEKYRELAKHPKVVAIGECGLDYFRIKSKNIKTEKERQKEIFRKQIELAIEIEKPLMIHVRDAHEEVLNIFNSYFLIRNSKLNGNIHFFSGNVEQAKKYLDLGFMISFTGVITFTKDYDEVIKNVALEKIMIETDAPFVAPIPYRGKQNEPFYVIEVAKKIAEIQGITAEEVVIVTTKNALKLIGIDS